MQCKAFATWNVMKGFRKCTETPVENTQTTSDALLSLLSVLMMLMMLMSVKLMMLMSKKKSAPAGVEVRPYPGQTPSTKDAMETVADKV